MKCYVLGQLRLEMALGHMEERRGKGGGGGWKCKGRERGEWERVSKVALGDIHTLISAA